MREGWRSSKARQNIVRHWRADIDAGPAVAAVAAVQERTGIALEMPGRHPKMARVAWHLLDVAHDVTLCVERVERDRPPVVAIVVAAEHPGPGDADHRRLPRLASTPCMST